jgi:hypothetical protein
MRASFWAAKNDQEQAYFARVETWRNHFSCAAESRPGFICIIFKLRSFFTTNQFRTGYATHGLFPYRGKFHPQMVKGVINTMGLKRGDTLLDPMMGSGTALIEASLMGIKSIGYDVSPFCRFMTQTKLTLTPLDPCMPSGLTAPRLLEESVGLGV